MRSVSHVPSGIRSDMTTNQDTQTFILDGAAIANFVRLQRKFLHWKQDTLASQAGISLRTVERIERGETVSPSVLRKLALALRLPENEFLRSRTRPTEDEMAARLAESFSWMADTVPVAVKPLKTEPQLKRLLYAHSLLLKDDLDPEAEPMLDELRGYLELAVHVRLEIDGVIGPKPKRDFRVRPLYRDVLDCVRRIERTHKAVCLSGTYKAALSDRPGETATIAVLAVRSRTRNPAIGTFRTLLAPSTLTEREIYAELYQDGAP